MANYVENIKVGSGEVWPIRDPAAQASIAAIEEELQLLSDGHGQLSADQKAFESSTASTLESIAEELANKAPLSFMYPSQQNMTFSQLNEAGEHSSSLITDYPTTAGVFRVGVPVPGLPEDATGYGALVIFNAGAFVMHLYVDSSDMLYWARTNSGSDSAVTSPSDWYYAQATPVPSLAIV